MYFSKQYVKQAIDLLGEYSRIIRFISAREGMKDCDAWVDNPDRPHIGALRYENKLYLAGEPHDDKDAQRLSDFLLKAVAASRLEGHALGQIPIRFFDYGLLDMLPYILKSYNLTHRKREYLEAVLPAENRGHQLCQGYRFAEVDDSLLRDERIENIDLLRSECAYRFDSMAESFGSFLGVSALFSDTVAGWCLSEYECSAGCEIGIEVLNEHRGLGIAKALVGEFLSMAAQAGLRRVGWHCYQDNLPSFRTAMACGFRQIVTYGELNVIFEREPMNPSSKRIESGRVV